MLIIISLGQNMAHHKGTPQKPSWNFSGIFLPNSTYRWYVQKDCHFSIGLSLELSNGLPVAFFNGISLL